MNGSARPNTDISGRKLSAFENNPNSLDSFNTKAFRLVYLLNKFVDWLRTLLNCITLLFVTENFALKVSIPMDPNFISTLAAVS